MAFNWEDHPVVQQANQVQPNQDQAQAAFNWNDHPEVQQDPSELEALGRGAANGLTISAEPALAGGIEALKQAVLNGDISIDDIAKTYKATRDSEKQANDKAAQSHPYISAAGNVIGSLPLAVLSGGAGELAEAANAGKLLPGALQAVKTGAAFGGVSGANNALSSGKDLKGISSDALEGAAIGGVTGGALNAGASALGEAAESGLLKKPVQAALQGYKAGSGDTSGANLLTEAGAKAIADQGDAAADVLGKLGINNLKSTGQAVGAARTAAQEAGTTLDLSNHADDIQKLIASGAKSYSPEAQADAQRLSSYMSNLTNGVKDANGDTLAPGIDMGAVPVDVAKQIQDQLTQMADVSDVGTALKNQAMQSSAGKIAANIGDAAKDAIPGLDEANANNVLARQSLQDLGVKTTDFRNGPDGIELKPQLGNRLNNLIDRSGRDFETASGKSANRSLDSALNKASQIDPDSAAAVQDQVQNAALNNELLQKAHGFNFANPSSYFKQGAVTLANGVGLAAGKAATFAAPATDFAGNVVSSAVSGISNSSIAQGARSLLQTGTPTAMKLASQLADAATKTGTAKNAALFSLLQQPGYRELMKQHIPGVADDTTSGGTS